MSRDLAAPATNQELGSQFHKRFQAETASIQSRIDQLENKPIHGGERQDAVEHCLAAITQLSNEVNEAAGYLPAYDQRACSNTIKALSEKLQGVRSAVAPKQKFSFKSARKIKAPGSPDSPASPQVAPIDSTAVTADAHSNLSSIENASAVDSVELGLEDSLNERLRDSMVSGPRKPSFSQTNRVVLSGHNGIHIILPSSATHATGASVLKDLTRCVVDLSVPSASGQTFAALTLQNIRDSLIICGQISGPIHITKVTNTVIVTACRQFRMHECKDVDVYLHCASRPIIEDCEGLRFASLPQHYHTESLRRQKNLWDQVDDFTWLKNEANPHWSRLPEQQCLPSSIWTDIVPGGPGIGVDDILKSVQGQRMD